MQVINRSLSILYFPRITPPANTVNEPDTASGRVAPAREPAAPGGGPRRTITTAGRGYCGCRSTCRRSGEDENYPNLDGLESEIPRT